MNRQMQQMMSILSQPDGLKKAMLQPSFQTEDGGEFSQAELVADVVNIMRMDTKRIGLAVGVQVEVNRMTPEYAAELLQGVAKGESTELVEIFDQIEDKRMRVLEAITDAETTAQWMERKANLLYTTGGIEHDAVVEEVASDDVDVPDPDEAAQAAHDAMQAVQADGGDSESDEEGEEGEADSDETDTPTDSETSDDADEADEDEEVDE